MSLSPYHEKYAAHPAAEVARRAAVKEEELRAIFSQVPLNTGSEEIAVAVLGCADKRFVPLHRDIFSRALGKAIKLTTFDITIEHLRGEEGMVQHDVTQPLPDAPYDITYSHCLLKFINTEKQLDVLNNSVAALKSGGLAIHVLDRKEYESTEPRLPDGYYAVPLNRWRERLEKEKTELIAIHEISLKFGKALVLKRL